MWYNNNNVIYTLSYYLIYTVSVCTCVYNVHIIYFIKLTEMHINNCLVKSILYMFQHNRLAIFDL